MSSFISQSPVYNLKAVLKETGLKADVLRAWERRYDLPKPQRTSGGHRLYSEYDIETVKWLKARQVEGLSISRAVSLWNEIHEAGRDPLVEHPPARVLPTPAFLPVSDTPLEILRQNWLEACMVFNADKAEGVLNQAFAIYPVEIVCTAILQFGLNRIGHYWYLNKASVQQEHFASALSVRRLETLITATPHPTRAQTVLVGCPPGEWHTFSPLLLTLLLRRRGLGVVYLGADIPVEQFEETAGAIHPDLIVLAAQQLTTAASTLSATRSLQPQGIPLAYGGLIFNQIPRLRERIPAHFLGETLEGSLGHIERLVAALTSSPVAKSVDEAYQELARLYREKRPLIELALFDELQKVNLQTEYIGEANFFFGNGLLAALELGDPAFLETDLVWVRKLLTRRQIPAERLVPYLAAYSLSIRKEMGKAGAPITDWIGSSLAQHEAAYP